MTWHILICPLARCGGKLQSTISKRKLLLTDFRSRRHSGYDESCFWWHVQNRYQQFRARALIFIIALPHNEHSTSCESKSRVILAEEVMIVMQSIVIAMKSSVIVMETPMLWFSWTAYAGLSYPALRLG